MLILLQIRDLKHTIHRLESTVLDLSERVTGMAALGFREQQQQEEEIAVEDPFVLLEKVCDFSCIAN